MTATTRTALPVWHVRWGIPRDMPDILRIERASFPPPFAWTEDGFRATLRPRNVILMIVEDRNERILGYMVYRLEDHGLTLLNFAVDPACRRLGVGGLLMRKLVGKLGSHRRLWIDATVSERNVPAHLFLRACGFAAVETLRGEYGADDGYRFRFDRDDTTEDGV